MPDLTDVAVPQKSVGLGSKVAASFSYLLAQSVAVKGLNLAAQILLAWLLAPRDFGLAGLGLTILAFADLVQRSGVRDILIHRQKGIRYWLSPGLSLNLSIGAATAVALAGFAHLIATATGKPDLRTILWVLSLTIPLNAVGTVFQAVLETQMRFGYIATVTLLAAACQTALSVVLAFRGWGALALVAPLPAVHVVRVACYWRPAHIVSKFSPSVRRWRYLYSHSATTFAAYVCAAVIWQGDYLLLGLFHGEDRLGYYYFAFNLSLQFVLLLTGNLGSALFPALAKLSHDPQRQLGAYISATRLIAFVGIPLSVFQAAVAAPGMFLLFGTKWLPAVPLMQVLCIGMAIRLVEWTSESLLKAQGRFRSLLTLSATHAAAFVVAVGIASRFGDMLAVAATVAALLVLFGPLRMYVAVKPAGGQLRDVAAILLSPLLCASAAAVPALLLVRSVAFTTRGGALALIGACLIIFITSYAGLAHYACPSDARRLTEHVRHLLARRAQPSR